MRQPTSLADAKAIFREERSKVTGSFSAIMGSRVLLAVLATFAIAFAANLLYSPGELPRVGGLSLAQAGLPPNVDFGIVGEQVSQASEAALREGATDRVQSFLTEHSAQIPLLNAIGLGLSLMLLLVNMTIMTRRRRLSRG